MGIRCVCVCVYVCVCFCVSVCVCLCQCVCMCLCVSVCVYVSVCMCLSFSVCVYLSVCLSVCVCLCVSVCLSVSASLYVCLPLWLCVCFSVCVSASLSPCLLLCMCVCLSVSVSASLHFLSPLLVSLSFYVFPRNHASLPVVPFICFISCDSATNQFSSGDVTYLYTQCPAVITYLDVSTVPPHWYRVPPCIVLTITCNTMFWILFLCSLPNYVYPRVAIVQGIDQGCKWGEIVRDIIPPSLPAYLADVTQIHLRERGGMIQWRNRINNNIAVRNRIY